MACILLLLVPLPLFWWPTGAAAGRWVASGWLLFPGGRGADGTEGGRGFFPAGWPLQHPGRSCQRRAVRARGRRSLRPGGLRSTLCAPVPSRASCLPITYVFTRHAKRCAARKFLTSYLGFCQVCRDSNGSDQPEHLFLFRRMSLSRKIVVQISRSELFKQPSRHFCPWRLPSNLGAPDSFFHPSVHQTMFPCFEL